MHPAIPPDVCDAIASWAALSRWERAEIGRALRRCGWTYGEIREVLPVPKGTLAGWCRDIRLDDAQVAAIRERTASRRGVPRDTQRGRRDEVARLRQSARAFAVQHLDDPLFVAGTVMYWAEGAKTERQLTVVNADARVQRLFLRWVRRFHDEAPRFVLSLHLHEGNDDIIARHWWAKALRLDAPDFTKTYIKPKGTGHRKNHLAHGVCKVRLRRSADAWIRTMGWIDAIGVSSRHRMTVAQMLGSRRVASSIG